MRDILSDRIAQAAIDNENFLLLSGDHGYALFDKLREVMPSKFINVGVMEQAMIGLAAGLTRSGHKVMCYGLSAFVPTRVLEQIKFNLCLHEIPVKIIGDGAGLVYTTLGNSHQCAEDISILRGLPGIEIFSPGDSTEMGLCFDEFFSSTSPAYLRVGKADNPAVGATGLNSTQPYFTHKVSGKDLFISTGAFLGQVHRMAKKFSVSHLSIMKIKPLHKSLVGILSEVERIFTFEEHVREGGLTSALVDFMVDNKIKVPEVIPFTLKSSFTEKCGPYQYALSEHGVSYEQIEKNLGALFN